MSLTLKYTMEQTLLTLKTRALAEMSSTKQCVGCSINQNSSDNVYLQKQLFFFYRKKYLYTSIYLYTIDISREIVPRWLAAYMILLSFINKKKQMTIVVFVLQHFHFYSYNQFFNVSFETIKINSLMIYHSYSCAIV